MDGSASRNEDELDGSRWIGRLGRARQWMAWRAMDLEFFRSLSNKAESLGLKLQLEKKQN